VHEPVERTGICIAVNRQSGTLTNVVWSNIVEAENMVGVAVSQQNGVQAVQASTHSLLAKIGSGVNDDVLALPRQKNGGAEALVMRVGGTADAAGTAECRHAHRCARTQHGDF